MSKLGRFGIMAGVLAVILGSAGCVSLGTVQSADTLGKGHYQIALEPGIYGIAAMEEGGTSFMSTCDLAFRYGVSERFDIGIRGGMSGVELQTKFLLSDPKAKKIALSFAPSVGGYFFGTFSSGASSSLGYFNIGIPLLIGIKNPNGNEFVFGPRINNFILTAGESSSGSAAYYLFGVGGTIGYSFSIGENFKVLPEFAFNVPVSYSSSWGGSGSAGLNGFIYQFKLGVMFGRTGH